MIEGIESLGVWASRFHAEGNDTELLFLSKKMQIPRLSVDETHYLQITFIQFCSMKHPIHYTLRKLYYLPLNWFKKSGIPASHR